MPVRSPLLDLSRRRSLPAHQPDKDLRAREKSETTQEEPPTLRAACVIKPFMQSSNRAILGIVRG